MDFSSITSETQKHAAGTNLPYNLNDNPRDNEQQWNHLKRTWDDPGAPISYGINSNGYRSPEFNTLDWDSSIVCIGDSMMFGTGNAECHTIPYVLSSMIGIPCINLGECNSSNLFMAETCLRLRELGINHEESRCC